MKQPKHHVRIWCPSSTGGQVQLGLLRLPGTPVWTPGLENFEICPAFPIQYSPQVGFSPVPIISVPIESLSESLNLRVSSYEKCVSHAFAEGDLYPFSDVHLVRVDSQIRRIGNEHELFPAERKGFVFSGDPDDIVPFPRYRLGSAERLPDEEPLWSSYEQYYSTEQGQNWTFSGQGRKLECFFHGTPPMESLWSVTTVIPEEFPPLYEDGSALVQQRWEYYAGIAQDFVTDVIADTIMVTPLLQCSVLTPSRESWLKDRSTSVILQKCESLSETRDAESEFQACYSALKEMREFSINGLEFIKDMAEIKELVVPLIDLLKAPLSAKRWAGFLLSYKWGWKTGYEDMQKLYEFMRTMCSPKNRRRLRRSLEKLHSNYGTIYNSTSFDGMTVECRYNSRVRGKLIYPVDWLDLDVIMNALGFSLNASNLWDMVPFSFIVDWFVSIQGLCEKVDLEADKSLYLHIQDHVYSQHYVANCTQISFSDGRIAYTGNLTLEKYVRDVSDAPTPTPWNLVPKYRSWWKHIGEVTLLVLANRK